MQLIIVIIIIIVVLLYNSRENSEKEKLPELSKQEEECNTVVRMLKMFPFYCEECGHVEFYDEKGDYICKSCGSKMIDVQNRPVHPIDSYVSREKLELRPALFQLEKFYFRESNYKKVMEMAEPLIEQGCLYAELLSAFSLLRLGAKEEYVNALTLVAEKGHLLALEWLGTHYAIGDVVEKNNVLARKYLLLAYEAGSYVALYNFCVLCRTGQSSWPEEIPDELSCLKKAAIHAVESAIYDLIMLNKTDMWTPFFEKVHISRYKIFWIRAMIYNMQNRVTYRWASLYVNELKKIIFYLEEYIDISEEALSIYNEYKKEADKYEKISNQLLFTTKEGCKGYLLEVDGKLEEALEAYREAAMCGDEMAIKAYRRLTGNQGFMLKTGKMCDADYIKAFDKSKEFFENGDYEQFAIQARKTLEIYVHRFLADNKQDCPQNSDLFQLINMMKRQSLISDERYNAMELIRHGGNIAVHSEKEISEEFARKIMNALNRVLDK